MTHHEPLLRDRERGADAMSEEQAEAAGIRIVIQLHRGSIDHARAALEDAWASHMAEKEPVRLDDPLSSVITDGRILNLLDSHSIATVKELFELQDTVLASWSSSGWTTVKKVRVIREDVRKRMESPPESETTDS